MHYSRWLRHGDERTVFTRRNGEVFDRNADGEKQCIKCLKWLPESMFHKSTKCLDKLTANCKDCARNKRRKRQFKIDFDAMLAEQNGQCAICFKSINSGTAAVDHDHSCCGHRTYTCGDCVRGILCKKCNVAIGIFKENIEAITNAARYLERWSS